MKISMTMLMAATLTLGAGANADSLEVSTSNIFSQSELSKSFHKGTTVRFHRGDEIPLSFTTGGDLIESTQLAETSVVVKRDFWIRIQNDMVLFSLDGKAFKPFMDSVTGQFEVKSETNGGFSLGLQSHLK